MRILCTHPGRAGDLIWALPSVRAIAESLGEKVDLLTTGEFASLGPLLLQQDYIGSFCAHEGWNIGQGWQPPVPTEDWDQVYHLGYKRWPERPLPYEVAEAFSLQIDLKHPWITIDHSLPLCEVACGFTEAWFELKYGLLSSVDLQLGWAKLLQLTPVGTRWTTETAGIHVHACSWETAAKAIAGSRVFFGDCSALHVLAVALGKRAIVVEPMEARHNQIFYPLGMDGPEVQVVKGNDGNFTFDARHCADVLKQALASVSPPERRELT